jgi:hypothetical protein
MFQHDQARAHMVTATRELLEEYNVNVIKWPPKGADLSPIELCFVEIQRRAKEHSRTRHSLAAGLSKTISFDWLVGIL